MTLTTIHRRLSVDAHFYHNRIQGNLRKCGEAFVFINFIDDKEGHLCLLHFRTHSKSGELTQTFFDPSYGMAKISPGVVNYFRLQCFLPTDGGKDVSLHVVDDLNIQFDQDCSLQNYFMVADKVSYDTPPLNPMNSQQAAPTVRCNPLCDDGITGTVWHGRCVTMCLLVFSCCVRFWSQDMQSVVDALRMLMRNGRDLRAELLAVGANGGRRRTHSKSSPGSELFH